MKTFFFFLSLSILSFSQALLAQAGSLRGQVLDAQSKEPLYGALVQIEDLELVASSDFDGLFFFPNLEAGTYTLSCQLLGYQTLQYPNCTIEAGQGLELEVLLKEEGLEVDIVVVEAKAYTHTEQALLVRQKNSSQVLDGISAAQFRKTGDRDAAAALSRVNGITVEGGKYVYVRGLSDRYSKTSLNGAVLPGLDPNRNTVQMDLFPSQILDNILVYKSMSADLPGDFTGGYIELETKEFPDEFELKIQASSSFNSQAHGRSQNLMPDKYPGDLFGLGTSPRQVPELVANNRGQIPSYQNSTAEQGELLSRLGSSFDHSAWALQRGAAPLDHSFSISLAQPLKLAKRPLGLLVSLSQERKHQAYSNGQYNIYELTDFYERAEELTPQLTLRDESASTQTLNSGFLSLNYAAAPGQQIGLLFLHNQSGESTMRFLEGRKQRDDPDDIFQTRTLSYLARSLSTVQLRGRHAWGKQKLRWLSAASLSKQDEPDIRYFSNRRLDGTELYFIKPSSDRIPSRFYRHLEQQSINNRIDYSIEFGEGRTNKLLLKTGFMQFASTRNFSEERYSFLSQNIQYQGDVNSYFAPENLLAWDNTENNYANGGRGLYLIDNIDPANTYKAWQQTLAGYILGDYYLNEQLQLVAGLRVEQNKNYLRSESTQVLERYPATNGETPLLNDLDLLPSINLAYRMSEQILWRLSYSRSLARPSFRELAPFASFDVEGGFILLGNPDLQRSRIDNIDLRWEWYPRSGEMLSLAAFYKNIDNAIERSYNPEQPNGEFSFRNVPSATVYGAEFELRKELGGLASWLKNFSISCNLAYIYSQSFIDERELSQIRASWADAPDSRPLFGQSPLSINALLSYKNKKGTAIHSSFQYVGKRISYISVGATPEIYELPRPMLSLAVEQDILKNFRLRLSASNLLGARYQEALFFKGQRFMHRDYALGLGMSLSLSYIFR